MEILKGTESIHGEIIALQKRWESKSIPDYEASAKIKALAKKLYYELIKLHDKHHPVVRFLEKRYRFNKFISICKPISEKDLYQLSRVLEING